MTIVSWNSQINRLITGYFTDGRFFAEEKKEKSQYLYVLVKMKTRNTGTQSFIHSPLEQIVLLTKEDF